MAFAQRTSLIILFFAILALPGALCAAGATATIGDAELRKVVVAYLQQQQNRYPQAEIRLRGMQHITAFHVPAGRLRWEITPSSPRLFDSRRFNFILRSDGRVVRNMTISVDLEALAPVAIAAADLPRGTILDANDLTMATMDLSGLRMPCLDAAELIGKKLRRSVRMGSPLTRSGVETPPLVKRGDLVTITASKGALTVTARGVAQQNGAEDDTILVKNIASKKDILCRVTAPSSVEVEL